MSKLKKPCNIIPDGNTLLIGKDKQGNTIEIRVEDLTKQPEKDICQTIETCSKIRNMEAKEAQLQAQIDTVNEKIDKVNPITNNPDNKGIKQRLDEAEACCEALNDKLNQNEDILKEVGDNISLIKSWNARQDEKIQGVKREVVFDDEFANFDEWVQEVYMPNADALVNKYTRGDIYINLTEGVASNNSFYINIRQSDATGPASANDWVMVPNNGMQDIISILGIDPIRVDRPGKHTWTISVEPQKLADFISELPRLDLSKVDVTLGEVYFDPIFKESATIEEDLNVKGKTTTKTLEVTDRANIKEACIEKMVCDTEYEGTQHFNNIDVKGNANLKNIKQEGGNVSIKGPNVKIEGDSVEIPNIQGDTHFSDKVDVQDINIRNNTETQNLNVTHTTVLNGHTFINGPFQFIDTANPQQKPICLENMAKNAFRPSYGMFKLQGEGFVDGRNRGDPYNNTVTFGIGSNGIVGFNSAQANPSKVIGVDNTGNNTQLIWENESYATPSVYLHKASGLIMIDGTTEDAGIYRIDFGCTMSFKDLTEIRGNQLIPAGRALDAQGKNTMESVRSGVVIYNSENVLNGGYIIDDKFHRYEMEWMFEHDHSYYDSDSYGSSETRRTEKFRYRHPQFSTDPADNRNSLYQYHKAAQWYTFTRSMLIKVDGKVIVAPYLKVASESYGIPVTGRFVIADGRWDTGSNSQISVQKIANLGTPYEYHC